MAKVHDFLEMSQGTHNLCAKQKEFCAQMMQRTAERYILNTENIMKASWSLLQHDSAAALQLSERSPLQPALSPKNHPGGQTQIVNVHQISRINLYPVRSDEDSAPEGTSVTEDSLNWTGDFDNPNDSEDDCAADVEFDLEQDNVFDDPECTEQRDVGAIPNVAGLIWPTRKSKRSPWKVMVIVSATETRRNMGVNRK